MEDAYEGMSGICCYQSKGSAYCVCVSSTRPRAVKSMALVASVMNVFALRQDREQSAESAEKRILNGF